MSSSTPPSQHEFHRYRKLVAWTSWLVVALGSLYILASVLVALYQQRNAVLGNRISAQLTTEEIAGCYEEFHDVSVALEKHLENAYQLLGGYDSDKVQGSIAEGTVWRKRWSVLGERCRFVERTLFAHNRNLEAMAVAHEELGSIQQTYSKELERFGSKLAPRLDGINKRVTKIGEDLAKSRSPAGAPP